MTTICTSSVWIHWLLSILRHRQSGWADSRLPSVPITLLVHVFVWYILLIIIYITTPINTEGYGRSFWIGIFIHIIAVVVHCSDWQPLNYVRITHSHDTATFEAVVTEVCKLQTFDYSIWLFRWGLCASVTGVTDSVVTTGLSPSWHNHSLLSTSFMDIVHDELLQAASFEHTANKTLVIIQVCQQSVTSHHTQHIRLVNWALQNSNHQTKSQANEQ